MMFVSKIALGIVLILICASLCFKNQGSGRTAHVLFDLNENRMISAPPGLVGDSIPYFSKEISDERHVTFRIHSEEFRLVGPSTDTLFVQQEQYEKLKMKSIDELNKDWKKSNKFLRNEVYDKIFLYEVISYDKIIRRTVIWVGGYEN